MARRPPGLAGARPRGSDAGTTGAVRRATTAGEARVSWSSALVVFGGVPVAILAAAATAYLGASGLWYVAVGAIIAVPLALVLHRYPLSGIMAWIVLMPFLVDDAGGGLRKLFWLTHRLLPVLTVILIVAAWRFGLRDRPLPRLGWPEVVMLAYVVLSIFSIGYLSQDDRALFDLYDRVVIPMALYLVVRLEEPDPHDLKRFVPVVAFLLLTQALIGSLAWVAPQVLPGAWLDRAGTRTTGSLRAVAVFGTTMVFAGTFFFHAGWNSRERRHRLLSIAGAALAGLMIFLTFSRASWLAGLVALAGIGFAYRGALRKALLVILPIAVIVVAVGGAGSFVDYANQRFLSDGSEQSALSRLPVARAAVSMFQERPLWGFGYGNFELFDWQYQESIPGLVVPEKDHAAHNLFLRVLAEQGLAGFLTFVGPMLVWLALAVPAARRLPREGVWSRQLLVALWLVIASFIVVNNFSNMKVTFGLGLWAIVLGQVAVVTSKALRTEAIARPEASESTASGPGAVSRTGPTVLRAAAAPDDPDGRS